MVRDVLLKQKFEKENFYKSDYINREKETLFKKYLNTDLIKVITGPRRVGKSTFCLIQLKNYNFMYVNFDDENLAKNDSIDTDELLKELHSIYGDTKLIFFDEIQNLKNWELFVNMLKREGYNLVITGSNAKLLSSELSTHLTGRYIPIELFTFSFKEFLDAKKYNLNLEYLNLPKIKGEILNLIEDYLINGGFPEVVIKKFEPKDYLSVLFDSIIFKDIVKRYRIKYPQDVENLSIFLINNFSNSFSYRKIQEILNFRSITTLIKYLDYLKEAFVLFDLNSFSFKIKKVIKSPKKIYIIDNGFIRAKTIEFSPNKGRLMENLLFIEFLRRGYDYRKNLFYYKTRTGKEIDFVIKKNHKDFELYQVSFSISNLDTFEREIKALIEGGEELNSKNLYIITWDEEKIIEKKDKRIKLIPLYKFLLAIH